MIKLSAVIITFNEENNLERCLRSLSGLADEIVILDSFSTDKTKDIALTYNAIFFQHAFDGHIQQKNRAITHASYPHILSLDADEALDDDLRKSILEAKNNWQYDGYFMNRFNNYCGQWIKHSGWYPDKKLRLWDSRKGSWKGLNPHDRYEMNDTNTPTGHLKGNILHYSYYTIEEHLKQTEYFSTISAKALLDQKVILPYLKLVVAPPAKFIKHYFLKQGFLDGYNGLIIAWISAIGTFRKYKYYLQYKRKQ